MSETRKEPDEIFCSSCGAAIKRRAEICPECGVRNRRTAPSTTHDPSEYETTVGENWYYAIIAPAVFTIPTITVTFNTISSEPPDLLVLPMVLFLAAVFLPIVGVYFDRQYVRANSEWNPSALWMIGFFLLYPLNVFLALIYLYRRHEALGAP